MLCITSNIASQRSPAITAVADITSGMLVYYKMTTATFSGNNFYNEITGTYDGLGTVGITAMTSTYPSPVSTTYMNFTQAITQYVTLPTINLTSYSQGLSCCFWFLKLSTLTANARFLQFTNNGNNIYSAGTSAGSTVSGINQANIGTTSGYNIFTSLTNNTWHHVCYTTNSTVSKYYIDGISYTFSGSAPGNFLSTLTGNTAYIGCNSGRSILNNYGCCEYRIYDRAITSAEVDLLYAYRP